MLATADTNVSFQSHSFSAARGKQVECAAFFLLQKLSLSCCLRRRQLGKKLEDKCIKEATTQVTAAGGRLQAAANQVSFINPVVRSLIFVRQYPVKVILGKRVAYSDFD